MTMDELSQLVPPGAGVSAGGETIILKPLKVGQIPAFLRAIGPVLQQLRSETIDWLALFGVHGESLLNAIAIATAKPQAWVDALDADEALALAAKVIEINADFFTRTVLPRLNELFAQVGDRVQQAVPAGSMPSNG
jgi:hypothetical protein